MLTFKFNKHYPRLSFSRRGFVICPCRKNGGWQFHLRKYYMHGCYSDWEIGWILHGLWSFLKPDLKITKYWHNSKQSYATATKRLILFDWLCFHIWLDCGQIGKIHRNKRLGEIFGIPKPWPKLQYA